MHRKMNRGGCVHRHGPRDSEREVAHDQGHRLAHGETRTFADGSAIPHLNQAIRNDPESNANGRSDTRRRGGQAGGEGRPEDRARLVESLVGGDPHRFDHVHHQPEGNCMCTALTRIHTFEGILTANSACIHECRDHAGTEHVSGQACGACGCCTRSTARKRGPPFPRAPCVTQRSTRTKGERGKREARRRK